MFFKCRSHILKWTTSQEAPERSIRVKFNIKVEMIYSECRDDISPVNLEELKTESDQMNQSLYGDADSIPRIITQVKDDGCEQLISRC